MEDSTTYQYAIVQGGIKEARMMLLDLGTRKFGAPAKKVETAIREVEDLPRLHRMGLHVLDATSWNDVLETP